jgi:hypothetical protein
MVAHGNSKGEPVNVPDFGQKTYLSNGRRVAKRRGRRGEAGEARPARRHQRGAAHWKVRRAVPVRA